MQTPLKESPKESVQPKAERAWLALAFCTAAFLVSSLIFNRSFMTYDDGVMLTGARLVLHGKVPYRDFWTIYAPGSYYANALMLALAGESFFSVRLAVLGMVVLQAGLIYGMLKRLSTSTPAAVLCAIAYLAFIPIGIPATSPIAYWLTLTIAEAYLLVRWVENPTKVWEYGIGVLLGLSALFRQDGGVYATVTILAAVWFIAPKIDAKRAGALLRILGSFAVITGSAIALLALAGALRPMINDSFKFALLTYPRYRSLPYPLPWSNIAVADSHNAPKAAAFLYQLIAFYIQPISLLILTCLQGRALFTRKLKKREMTAAAISLMALVLFLMVSIRPSGIRISGSVVLGLIAVAAVASGESKRLRTAAFSLLVILAVSFTAFAIPTVQINKQVWTMMLHIRGGIYGDDTHVQVLSAAAVYLREHTPKSEKILSGDPSVYFLAERDPATVYFEPHPGLTDQPEIQRRIISDMEKEQVRYYVRAREWGNYNYFIMEPQYQPRIFIDYIERNYSVVKDIYILQIYERKTPFRDQRG